MAVETVSRDHSVTVNRSTGSAGGTTRFRGRVVRSKQPATVQTALARRFFPPSEKNDLSPLEYRVGQLVACKNGKGDPIKLGSGHSSLVTLVYDPITKKRFALKLYTDEHRRRAGFWHRLQRERSLTGGLDPRFVITGQHVVRGEEGEVLGLLLPYASGGDLRSKLRVQGPKGNEYACALPLSQIRHYFTDLVRSVMMLHDPTLHGGKRILHRDLKPANLLRFREKDAVSLRVADFDCATHLTPGETLLGPCRGTAEFLAPEAKGEGVYDHAIDWWAVGCILAEMVAGQPCLQEGVFVRPTEIPLVKEGELRMISAEAPEYAPVWDLIERLLEPDPKKRKDYVFAASGTAKERCILLEHPFLRQLPQRVV